jgi:CheY-like chemotaxis protein
MPIMDGCEATLKIRNHILSLGLEQPIIICVTGHTEESYILKAYKHGINGVSSKPIDMKMMHKVLKVLMYI